MKMSSTASPADTLLNRRALPKAMTDELQALRYRAQGDGAGFQAYVATLERNRNEWDISVVEHEASLERLYKERTKVESEQPTFRFAFLRDLFSPKKTLQELEQYRRQIETQELLLVRARVARMTLDERIEKERMAFTGERSKLVSYAEFASRRHQHS